jgi:PTS system nitrogen regulatory IIA component
MKIAEILSQDAVVEELNSTTKAGVLEELSAVIEKVSGIHLKERLVRALEERERLGSTGIGDGVAIPHGKLKEVKGMVAAFGRSTRGLDFQSIDGRPAHIFFLLVAPEEMAGPHLKALARISRLLKEPARRKAFMDAKTREDIYRLIAEGDEKY